MFDVNKGIITMVIRPLDDATYFARGQGADLEICRKLRDCSWHHSTDSQSVPKSLICHFLIYVKPYETSILETQLNMHKLQVTQKGVSFNSARTNDFLI